MAAKKKSRKRKNRKQSAQVPFPTVLANVLVLVVVIGLSYIWLCSRCDTVGKEIKTKEYELVKAKKSLERQIHIWEVTKTPVNLKRAINKHRLKMEIAKSAQCMEIGFDDRSQDTVAMIGR